MTETAIVVRTTGKTATLRCNPGEACRECALRNPTGVPGCSLATGTYTAMNDQDFELGVGDLVDVVIPRKGQNVSAIALFVVPLALFAIGYLFAGDLVRGPGELVRVAFGLGGLAVGLGAGFLVGRSVAGEPRIVGWRPGAMPGRSLPAD